MGTMITSPKNECTLASQLMEGVDNYFLLALLLSCAMIAALRPKEGQEL